MALTSLSAVFIGAGFGACLRWWLGLALNPLFPNLPLGTLAANLIGGFLIGIAAMTLSIKSGLPPEIRLLVITGFLGGLTTFSSFSAEAVGLLMESRYAWGILLIASHLIGSIVMTVLGIFTVRGVTA